MYALYIYIDEQDWISTTFGKSKSLINSTTTGDVSTKKPTRKRWENDGKRWKITNLYYAKEGTI